MVGRSTLRNRHYGNRPRHCGGNLPCAPDTSTKLSNVARVNGRKRYEYY